MRFFSVIILATILVFILPLLWSNSANQVKAETKPPVEKTPNNLRGRKVVFEITAYTAHDRGMNGKGITASGVRARRWHTVAASRSYPFGTRIHIPALGKTFTVEDRGGAIRGNRLDLFVGDRKEALKFGRRKLEGIILHDYTNRGYPKQKIN